MTYIHFCPDCGKKFESEGRYLTACNFCHEKRKKVIADKEALYPSAEQLGLENSKGPTLPERIHRGHKKRIVRKSEPMGG